MADNFGAGHWSSVRFTGAGRIAVGGFFIKSGEPMSIFACSYVVSMNVLKRRFETDWWKTL